MLARLTHRLPWFGMVVVRLGCYGRDERLAFGAQLQALAPAMECFRRHSHKHLPLHRAELAFSFLLKKSILEMRQKCERFQAFLDVSPTYLGVRVAVSDARSKLPRNTTTILVALGFYCQHLPTEGRIVLEAA